MKKLKFKKLKLKSVYTRYMLIFMAIMFFTVAILGILVTTIAGNYATETKKNELSETNRLFRTTVLAMNGEYETLEEKLKANESELRENLSFAFFAMSDCGVVITDNKGKIAFFAYRDASSGEPVILYGDTATQNKDIIGKKNGHDPYIWDEEGCIGWYGFKPTYSDYEKITDTLHDYMSMFADENIGYQMRTL